MPGAGTDYVHTGHPEGGTVADINNDGYIDFIFQDSPSESDLWLNDGDYTYTFYENIFAAIGLPEDVGCCDGHENMEYAWGDFDNDGDLDVYISGDDNEGLYQNNGTGGFTDVSVAQ